MGTQPLPLRPDRVALPRAVAAPSSTGRPTGPGACAASDAGPNFRALLEGLVGQVQELDRAAQELQGPAELAGAVATARASLEDALSLREQLLAAYRETLQRDGDDARP